MASVPRGGQSVSSVTQSCPTLCNPMDWMQHARLSCPSPTPRTYSNSCPLSRWCRPTISSSVAPFPSCFQSFSAPGSFPMSQFFTSGDQTIGISALASVLPMNIQDWFPLGWTGWISLHSKGLSWVFSNTPQSHFKLKNNWHRYLTFSHVNMNEIVFIKTLTSN